MSILLLLPAIPYIRVTPAEVKKAKVRACLFFNCCSNQTL